MSLYFHSLSAGHREHWKRKNNYIVCVQNLALPTSSQPWPVWDCAGRVGLDVPELLPLASTPSPSACGPEGCWQAHQGAGCLEASQAVRIPI